MNAKYKDYQTRDRGCWRRECFVPFTGNGHKICRNYELGLCPVPVCKHCGTKIVDEGYCPKCHRLELECRKE